MAAATPDIRVADVSYNTGQICRVIDEAWREGAKIVAFPELCVTGYTCGDLFFQDVLLKRARKAILEIAEFAGDKDMLAFVGMPLMVDGKLYNVAAALNKGKILGFTTKTFLPNYSEFYEMRQFSPGPAAARKILFEGGQVQFGPCLLYQATAMEGLVVGAEICEDVWSVEPPSIRQALAGATVIVNCSASDETVGKEAYRRELIRGQSARLIAGYVYANAGEGESTTDLVFGGYNVIAENGAILKESERFVNGTIYSEIDIQRLLSERRKNTTFQGGGCHGVPDGGRRVWGDGGGPDVSRRGWEPLPRILFEVREEDVLLTRAFPQNPFVPQDGRERSRRCEEILTIQAMGLKKRLSHARAESAVVGISGGLDSTLALLVAVRAFEMLGIGKAKIYAVTMPCFGTTDRTYQNACEMVRRVGATLMEVPISEAVALHFRDIGHDPSVHNAAYENSQARERTQVLMDVANDLGGIVIGTGDMSELALGWATYNGDHMSMYGVNASVPKTLVRHLVQYVADETKDAGLKNVLYDVLDTPVSRNFCHHGTGTSRRRRRIWSGRTSCMISSYIICCVLATSQARFTVWRSWRSRGNMTRGRFSNGWRPLTEDFLRNKLNVPVCRTGRKSGRWPYPRAGIGACRVTPAWRRGWKNCAMPPCRND